MIIVNKNNIKNLLYEKIPILTIIIGSTLVSLPIGPYYNADTQLEFNTAQGVLKWGYPYLEFQGNFVDVPPLGFYTEALFFLVFGITYENGIALITLFGIACTYIVFKLGKELHSRSVGLLAATFFGLAPWKLVLTRTFLIDTQCLFLSLACLYLGIIAIQSGSVKFAALSGIFFTAAFLTKQYAIYIVIPLLLLFIWYRPKNRLQLIAQLCVFIIPALCFTFLWYQIIMEKELLYLVQHTDFTYLNFPEVIPSYSFVFTFLVDYGLGLFFFSSTIFSLIIGLLYWKYFSKPSRIVNLVYLIVIISILSVNIYLGVTLNLKAPYTSAVKYTYQALPFFSLSTASLAHKSISLIKSPRNLVRSKRDFSFYLGLIGLLLLITTIIASMNTARELISISYLVFRVQPNQNVGYTFFVDTPISQNDPLVVFQLIGFLIIFSGLLWAFKCSIRDSFRPMYNWIQEKKALSMKTRSS